ncbi:hypothetical protein ACH5RR_016919 [Cinchona calisaya]|uniref:MULE transposase domain-containing protein n=1 Tax=Cinchona calisaya TaxID=153742 RepID=A0ABD3A0Q5_9GENT
MFTYRSGENIEFEKGMLFTNVDAFRAILKDYVIQKEFPIQRLKNEKASYLRLDCNEGSSELRDNPQMTNLAVLAEIRKFGLQPSKMQIYRAKKKALEEIEGTHSHSYTKLPKYAELLRQTNPGITCKIHYDRPSLMVESYFRRLFISYKASKDSFLVRCKPFIGFDGCHLKGPYGGVFLCAISVDGNNSFFPLEFVVVECENKETWA